MLVKRKKFSLRDCNPPEKKTRRRINELDFDMKFPFYNFDKNKIDLNLLRRFLYQNDIKSHQLYTREAIDKQLKERVQEEWVKEYEKFVKAQEPLKRCQILDIPNEV